MHNKILTYLLLLSASILAYSCTKSSEIVIDGKFHGMAGQLIELEELSPSGSKTIDSTRTTVDGEFYFTIVPKNDNPTFYNLRYRNGFVPLLLSASERVAISSVGNVFNNYTISGSEGSLKVRELNMLTLRHTQSLDSLVRLYDQAVDSDEVARLGRAFGAKYIQLKQQIIRFVVSNASSMASIVPLYQPVLNNKFIFDDPTDIVYFRVVADSLGAKYPTSPYVISLQNDIKRVDNAFAMDSLITGASRATLPEITMKDAEGQTQSLSSLKGKVVLLDFTSYSTPELKSLNHELKETYSKYSSRGFEIFQVCVDQNRASWVKTIIETRLPWITVSDHLGPNSPALSTFNVTDIPTRLLIDRQGNILGYNLRADKLDAAIAANL